MNNSKPPTLTIRAALGKEWKTLSQICLLSKGYWNYPAEYMQKWMKELTITPEYISRNQVTVMEEEGEIKALYTLIDVPQERRTGSVIIEAGLWIDHFFVHPDHLNRGLGRKLWQHLIQSCAGKKLLFFVDPHAKGFYIKMGCNFVRMSPSGIERREIPVFEYIL